MDSFKTDSDDAGKTELRLHALLGGLSGRDSCFRVLSLMKSDMSHQQRLREIQLQTEARKLHCDNAPAH